MEAATRFFKQAVEVYTVDPQGGNRPYYASDLLKQCGEGKPIPSVMEDLMYAPHRSSPLSPLLFSLGAFASGLSRPRHAGRNMIAGAVSAFLCLKYRIIHVYIVLHCGQVFMPQQLL